MNKTITYIMLFLLSLIIGCAGTDNESARKEKVIIFHAGSLSVPMNEIAAEFEKENPGIDIQLESAGSVACARKITDLHKPCDIMASADYRVIDEMLIPEKASWNIRFASNSMVIAYNEKSARGEEINTTNWIDILLDDDIIYGRSDPDSDPCGYRTVIALKLAEKHYNRKGITEKLINKDRNMIRPEEVDLLALLETNSVDYIFQYKSVSKQHNLKYLELPGEINLSDPGKEELYQQVSTDILGKSPREYLTINGSTMIYGVTLLENAPNREAAIKFLTYMVGEKGMKIIDENGQILLNPPLTSQLELLPEKLKSICLAD